MHGYLFKKSINCRFRWLVEQIVVIRKGVFSHCHYFGCWFHAFSYHNFSYIRILLEMTRNLSGDLGSSWITLDFASSTPSWERLKVHKKGRKAYKISENSGSSRVTLKRWKIPSLIRHRRYLSWFAILLDTCFSFINKTFIFYPK